MKLQDYKTIVFDCDGVILNSNKVKSDAFSKVAKKFGKDEAKKLVSYNKKNGGVSRYLKFQYFINEILHPNFKADKKITVESLAKQFSNHVVKGLRECELVANLDEFRKSTKSSSWMIISGGDEAELRKVFDIRDLSKFFDRGIFGSPTPKNKIFKREIEEGNIVKPALFIGDSKFDYECSKESQIDFVFAYQWTEFTDWKKFCSKNKIKTIDYVTNL
jgi:HAD superfamily hydrolase (TIGR01549 family)